MRENSIKREVVSSPSLSFRHIWSRLIRLPPATLIYFALLLSTLPVLLSTLLIRAPSCNFDLLCSSLIRFAEDVFGDGDDDDDDDDDDNDQGALLQL